MVNGQWSINLRVFLFSAKDAKVAKDAVFFRQGHRTGAQCVPPAMSVEREKSVIYSADVPEYGASMPF